MLFSTLTIAAAALVSTAVAKTIPIMVGMGGELKFSPNSTTAAVDDILEFTFFPKNHTVTQGPFAAPCSTGNLTNSVFSGFMPTALTTGAPSVFQVKVNATTPLWFYCSQSVLTHCQKGMVMVVNEPTSGPNTLAAYAAGAAKTTLSEVPNKGMAMGGVFSTSNSTSTSSGSGSNTSTTAPASSTSAKSGANTLGSLYDMVAVGVVSVGAIVFGMAL